MIADQDELKTSKKLILGKNCCRKAFKKHKNQLRSTTTTTTARTLFFVQKYKS